MTARKDVNGLSIAKSLYDFVQDEALPGTGIRSDRFWAGLADIIRDFQPRNQALLAVRDKLQALIDDYYRAHQTPPANQAEYERFLRKIGYLLPEPASFAIRIGREIDQTTRVAFPGLRHWLS